MTTSGKDLRVIVAGGGDIGLRTAELLDERGHDVVIIEQDAARCAELADAYVATVIEGDATLPSILEQADPQAATPRTSCLTRRKPSGWIGRLGNLAATLAR